jgi:hypothetical protein
MTCDPDAVACIPSHVVGSTDDGGTIYLLAEPCEGCVRHVRDTTCIQAIIWPGGAVALP